MGRRGPGALPQAEKREQYARLIAQGYNNMFGDESYEGWSTAELLERIRELDRAHAATEREQRKLHPSDSEDRGALSRHMYTISDEISRVRAELERQRNERLREKRRADRDGSQIERERAELARERAELAQERAEFDRQKQLAGRKRPGPPAPPA